MTEVPPIYFRNRKAVRFAAATVMAVSALTTVEVSLAASHKIDKDVRAQLSAVHIEEPSQQEIDVSKKEIVLYKKNPSRVSAKNLLMANQTMKQEEMYRQKYHEIASKDPIWETLPYNLTAIPIVGFVTGGVFIAASLDKIKPKKKKI